MADEIRQLIDMVVSLKVTVEEGFAVVDKKFEGIDRRFDTVEVAIKELNSNQIKIMNSMKLIERDIKSNKAHIERLEEKESYL